jgi:hypothetical protein
VLGDQQVLVDRLALGQADELEGAAHPQRGAGVRRQAGDVDAEQLDPPGVGGERAGQSVEHRRLAGAVRAHEADDRAAVDAQVGVVHRLQPAEADAHAGGLQHGHPGPRLGQRRHPGGTRQRRQGRPGGRQRGLAAAACEPAPRAPPRRRRRSRRVPADRVHQQGGVEDQVDAADALAEDGDEQLGQQGREDGGGHDAPADCRARR